MYDGIFISKEMYASEIMKRFIMRGRKPTPTPVDIHLMLRKEVVAAVLI